MTIPVFKEQPLANQKRWTSEDQRLIDYGIQALQGNTPSGMRLTPEQLARRNEAALRLMGGASNLGPEYLTAYEAANVTPYINSKNPAYQRTAINYLVGKVQATDYADEAVQALKEALSYATGTSAPLNTYAWEQYAKDLAMLAALDPYDTTVQQAATKFGAQGSPMLAPDAWMKTQIPLKTLLQRLTPTQYQAAGLPTIQTRTPTAMDPYSVSRDYQKSYDYFTQFMPEPMRRDYLGKPGGWVKDTALLDELGLGQVGDAASAGQYLDDLHKDAVIDAIDATGESDPVAKTASTTDPATVDAVKTLKLDRKLRGPSDAKAWMIGPNNKIKPELIEKYGGDPMDRSTTKSMIALAKLRAIINKLDEYIEKGYKTTWPPDAEL